LRPIVSVGQAHEIEHERRAGKILEYPISSERVSQPCQRGAPFFDIGIDLRVCKRLQADRSIDCKFDLQFFVLLGPATYDEAP
jgi:hypothetical protein